MEVPDVFFFPLCVMVLTTSVMGAHWLNKYHDEFASWYHETYHVPFWIIRIGDLVTHWLPLWCVLWWLRTHRIGMDAYLLSWFIVVTTTNMYLDCCPLPYRVYPIPEKERTQRFTPILFLMWVTAGILCVD